MDTAAATGITGGKPILFPPASVVGLEVAFIRDWVMEWMVLVEASAPVENALGLISLEGSIDEVLFAKAVLLELSCLDDGENDLVLDVGIMVKSEVHVGCVVKLAREIDPLPDPETIFDVIDELLIWIIAILELTALLVAIDEGRWTQVVIFWSTGLTFLWTGAGVAETVALVGRYLDPVPAPLTWPHDAVELAEARKNPLVFALCTGNLKFVMGKSVTRTDITVRGALWFLLPCHK